MSGKTKGSEKKEKGSKKAMKKLLALAWNDIRVELSDRSSIVFIVVLPLLFTWILGATLGGSSRSGGDNRFVLSVVDEDQSSLSRDLISTLNSSPVVRPVVRSKAEADRLFKENKTSALTIPAAFDSKLLAGQESALAMRQAQGDVGLLAEEQAVQAASGRLSGAVLAARASVAEAERIKPFADQSEREAYFAQSLKMAENLLNDPPARLEVTAAPEALFQQADSFQQSSAGQMVTWVLVTLMGVAEVLVNERLWGTLRRLFVMPAGKGIVLAGKLLGRLCIGLVQTAIMIGFGAWVLGVNWGRSPWALLLVIGAFALSAVAFGVMLGTFATTRNQAAWLVIFFSMITAALGGAWWPLEITPALYQQVVKVLPTTWAMTGLTDVLVRGQGVAAVLPVVGILMAFAVVFFVVGLWRFRYE